MTLQGTLWLRSPAVVFPPCPVNVLQWSRSLQKRFKNRSVWYHESRSASSSRLAPLFGAQPSSSSLVLETCPVMELRESRAEERHAWPHLLGGLAKTHLLTYLRSKRNVCTHICAHFLHFGSAFPSFDAGSVRLLLVLSCGRLLAAARNTFQTLTRSFKEPGLRGSVAAERLVPWPTNVPPQLVHHQSSGSHSQDPVLKRGESERGKQSVHAASWEGKHEKDTFPEQIFGLSGVDFYAFLQSALRKQSRTALLTVIHGRRVSNRI